MNTYDYMYDVLKLRGTIDINFQQLMRLRDEGIPFVSGYVCTRKVGLALECWEAMELEKEISNIICSGDKDIKQVIYVTDIWKWKYLEEEYAKDDRDGGIHFANLIIYYKEEE